MTVHSTTLNTPRGVFCATLTEADGNCYEEVWREAHGERERIHYAYFSPRLLGASDRDGYTRTMCASIAAKWHRDHFPSILWNRKEWSFT